MDIFENIFFLYAFWPPVHIKIAYWISENEAALKTNKQRKELPPRRRNVKILFPLFHIWHPTPIRMSILVLCVVNVLELRLSHLLTGLCVCGLLFLIGYLFVLIPLCGGGRCRTAPELTVPLILTALWMELDMTRVNSLYLSVIFSSSCTSYLALTVIPEAFDTTVYNRLSLGWRVRAWWRRYFRRRCLSGWGIWKTPQKPYNQNKHPEIPVHVWKGPWTHWLVDKVAVMHIKPDLLLFYLYTHTHSWYNGFCFPESLYGNKS